MVATRLWDFSLLCPSYGPTKFRENLVREAEADRKNTTTQKMRKKYRTHFQFVVGQKRHRLKYGIHRVRAVLTETFDTAWAEALREAAQHPIVSGANPSPLFWFTASQIF